MLQEQLIQILANELPHGVLLADGENRLSFINERARAIMGFAPGICEHIRLTRFFVLEGDVFQTEGVITQFTKFFHPPKMPLSISYRRTDLDGDRFLLLIDAQYANAEQPPAENSAYDHFFSTILHEIRTPINIVANAADFLFRKLDEPEKRQNHLNIINRNIRRILKTVNNLLLFSKEEETGWPCQPERGDFVKYLSGSVESIAEYARGNGVEIEMDFRVREAMALYDPEMMEHIIVNLLSNAIKFSPEGQKVKVSTRKKTSGTLLVSIQDNGIGIPKEEQQEIFRKFKQAKSMTIQKNQGSGIGLYLVKMLCEKQNIRIRLESEVGAGSTFTLEIPADGIVEGHLLHDGRAIHLTDAQTERYDIAFSDSICI